MEQGNAALRELLASLAQADERRVVWMRSQLGIYVDDRRSDQPLLMIEVVDERRSQIRPARGDVGNVPLQRDPEGDILRTGDELQKFGFQP